MSIVECTDLRIGATAAALQLLRRRGIPEPESWTYVPYSVQRTNGNGQPVGYGHPTASWSWEALDQNAIGALLAFFDEDTDASAQVYISTYTDPSGRVLATDDFSAYMWRPIDGEGKAMFPGSVGRVWQNVTLTFTHLEAV